VAGFAMRRNLRCTLVGIALTGACGSGWAAYTDSRLLDVPWGNYSFIRQGWRGYLETVPAARYREGLGVVWGQAPPHKTADEVAASLAWAGFRRVRLEIPWGSVRWDETGLNEADAHRTIEILRALKAHGLRPLILLNANHLQPCPLEWRDFTVQRAAPAGDSALAARGDVEGLSGSPVTLMSLADGTSAGPLITAYSPDPASGAGTYVIRLSKPLPRALTAHEVLRAAILRYPPLYPVGTPQFESTAAGWLRYVTLVVRLVATTYGSDAFDVEIWNELTFGSAYLDINSYRAPQAALEVPELLHRGGSAWELANRTVRLIKRTEPNTSVIWGFSNTTFFHTPITELPSDLDGQSYHPYGTGRRCYADLVRGRRELLLDSYVPSGCAIQPEGYAQGWQQTESLLRFLAPAARHDYPPGSGRFGHFITEHGLSPSEIGISDPKEAAQAKQKFLLRAPLFWLNKGLTALYVYDVYEPEDDRWGVFRSDGEMSAGMQALHRLTAQFAAAAAAPAEARQLTLEVAREGPRAGVLPGDPRGDHLPQEDAAAFLPFQVDPSRFVIAAYIMTQDFPRDLSPQPYRVTVTGVDGRHTRVRYYSPASDSVQPVAIVARSERSITLRLSITDVPNLIEIGETQPTRKGESGWRRS